MPGGGDSPDRMEAVLVAAYDRLEEQLGNERWGGTTGAMGAFPPDLRRRERQGGNTKRQNAHMERPAITQ